MPYPVYDCRLMIEVLRATRERIVCEFIRDSELASSYQLEKMRRVKMVKKQAAWEREVGFDRIEIIAKMQEHTLRRLHAGFDSKPLYTELYNHPRWPPNSEEFKLEIDVKVERLRMTIQLSQPLPPPQYDLLPRRSSAADTGLDEPGVPHTRRNKRSRSKHFLFACSLHKDLGARGKLTI